ncbi:MAG: iron ABC transporter permease [Chloroflexi bacterium]|nr:iron ABC transporter permease [Chloroflexota bacterium]
MRRSFSGILPWLAPIAFLGLFFFYPLARILALGFDFSSLSASVLARASHVLLFTFYQATLSTILTLCFGLPLAFLFARFDFPAKSFFRALTAIPFMLPTVVVAAGFNALLGPRGWINLGLMSFWGLEHPPVAFVGTLWAILAAHVFYNATIVIRLVGNAWAALDIRLTDAARSLGASPIRTLLRVTLPLLRPSIFAASLLVFLFDFTSYGVILLLGGPKFTTIEVEIYIQALQMLNLPAAALLSVIQLLCTLAFSAIYSRYIVRVTSPLKPRAVWMNVQKPRTRKARFFVAAMLAFSVLFFALPLLAPPLRSISRLEADRARQAPGYPGLTVDYYRELFINRRDSLFYVPPLDAARNSLAYASLTVFLALLLGFPAAIALSRPGKLEKWIDPFLMLPLGASAVTLGLGYIITFNRPILDSGFTLLTSPLLIPLAHTTIALPFVIRNLQTALATIPNRYREAAAVLGASRWQTWKSIDWPIISRAVISAGAFAFTVSLGEFGAASLLARPEYPTLPTAIYRFLSQPGGMNYGQAMAMATILMLVSGLAIFMIEKLRFPGTGEF